MNYLLDTHTLVWALENRPSLSSTVRDILQTNDNSIFVSVVSFWELAIKTSLQKITLNYSPSEMLENLHQHDITVLGIEASYIKQIETMPFLHRDPFDRLLIATALSEKLILLSADRAFRQYSDLNTLW